MLELVGVRKTYWRGGGLLSRRSRVPAVQDADITLFKGETLGLVGESGSGKSTLARCIVRLIQPEAGAIRFHDTDLTSLTRAYLETLPQAHPDGVPGPVRLAQPAPPGGRDHR